MDSTRRIRVYVDTSVFGGPFDEEFRRPSEQFFEHVQRGAFDLVTSVLVSNEIVSAPEQVRSFFQSVVPFVTNVDVTNEAVELQNAYLRARIVTKKYSAGALHVAIASASGCTVIVSWNFRHIVHFTRIPLYNAVNLAHGYQTIGIFSPLEVVGYEKGV